jgi:hypothetical protein
MSDDSDDSIYYRNGRYHENPQQRTLSYLYEPSARVGSPLLLLSLSLSPNLFYHMHEDHYHRCLETIESCTLVTMICLRDLAFWPDLRP